MATTHALAGMLFGVAALFVAPEHAGVAATAGFAGGLFPDLDLYAGHRKTLHFPSYYWAVALPALVAAAVVTTPATVAAAAFLLAAAVHSISDAFGGGLELRPWRGDSRQAVYDHRRGRWLPPRRWVRYDGAPEDLALAAALAAPSVAVLDGPFQMVALATLAVSACYALVRKPMVAAAEWLVGRLPADVLAHIPDRFVADLT